MIKYEKNKTLKTHCASECGVHHILSISLLHYARVCRYRCEIADEPVLWARGVCYEMKDISGWSRKAGQCAKNFFIKTCLFYTFFFFFLRHLILFRLPRLWMHVEIRGREIFFCFLAILRVHTEHDWRANFFQPSFKRKKKIHC